MIPGNANPLLLATAAADAAAAAVGPIKSLRFNPGDSAYLARTPSSNGNLTTSTFACWVKRCDSGTNRTILAAGDNSQDYFHFEFRSDDRIKLTTGENGSTNQNLVHTEAKFRDPSAWYHVVLQLNFTDSTQADRVKIYVNGTRQTLSGTIAAQNYTGTRFNRSSVDHQIGRARDSVNHLDAYLADIYFIDGSALDATSFGAYDNNGVWQAAAYSGTYGTNGFHLLDFENESTVGHDSSGNNNDFTAYGLTTTAPVSYSSNGSITNNDGRTDQVGSFAAVFNGTQSAESSHAYGFLTNTFDFTWNLSTAISYSNKVEVWTGFGNGSVYLNGGSAVSSNNNNWTTLVSGSSGTITSIRFTTSGNGGWWAGVRVDDSVLVNGDPADFDVLFDSPTNGSQSDGGNGGEISGNYCTFNPVDSNQTHSNGNLFVTCAGGTSPRAGTGTIAVSSGKYYYEATVSGESVAKGIIGFVEAAYDGNGSTIPNGSSNGVFYFGEAGNKIIDNSSTSYGASYGNGDVIGVALNLDDDEITFYKNGTSQGTITTKTFTGAYKLAVGRGSSSGSTSYTLNTGQRAFAYAAPSGFKTLNTASLPTPTIADGRDNFDTDAYAGTGSAHERSNFSFQPDFVWIKERDGTQWHYLIDSVRGNTKALFSNRNRDEFTTTNQVLTSFDNDGFSLGTDTAVNASSKNYIAWCWKAASSTASNTDGSITSSVRANPTAGFSIVTYTGTGSAATVGHGLNAAPEMIILKGRNFSDDWRVYHKFLDATEPEDYYMILQNTTVRSADQNASFMNDTAPTSTVFSLGTDSAINGSSQSMLAYCFSSVDSYQAIGSYVGTGNDDGPFVHCGFRPAFVFLRDKDTVRDWRIYDNKRPAYNPVDKVLIPNGGNIEDTTSHPLEFLSNGFKVRGTLGGVNDDGDTMIYLAIAESPFQANGGLAR